MLFLFAYINNKLPISLDEMWVINAVVRNDKSTVLYNYIMILICLFPSREWNSSEDFPCLSFFLFRMILIMLISKI
jgi:hypothetical protein